MKIHKAALLAAVGIMGLSLQRASAAALPNVYDEFAPFAQFQNAKTGVGPNGNESLIWDYFSSVSLSGYQGSSLWILNSTGQVVATGNTLIPASVGTGVNKTTPLSNTAVHVYPSGNTQVAFAFGSSPTNVTGFSTWTYNAQGKLIAGSPLFSYTNTHVADIAFQDGVLIVKWAHPGGANSAWVLDEFGNVISVAGPYGPFTDTDLGQVRYYPSTQNQLWQWIVVGNAGYGLTTWSIKGGTVIATSTYGPY